MAEESFVSRAEVVQTGLAIGSLDEPVLGTFSVTRKANFTLAAVLGKCVELIVAKFLLLLRSNKLS